MSFPMASVAYRMGEASAVELAYSEGDGSVRQTIPAGSSVDFGTGAVSGPAPLSSRFSVATGSAAIAYDFNTHPDRSTLTCRLGGLWTDLRITATSGATVLGMHDRYGSLLMGCSFWLEPVSRLRLKVDQTYALTSPLWSDWSRMDLTLGYRLIGENVLFAGFRWWSLEYENDPGLSDVDLDMSGPVFGVELRF